ncbi:MAG TPA: dTMP kinase [Acidimicrobiia bacterium]|nr:dTMP kinase [Acidimicrobiia bacterium]
MTHRYIAIEGADGAGKSTIAAAVVDRLRAAGRSVRLVREPGGTEIGEEIRRLLLHGSEMSPWTEALLFAAQRAQLVDEVVGPALEAGDLVVSDRSYFSSLAYQGEARGLGVEAVRSINEAGLAGVVPDLVVVLWLDPDVALARQEELDRIGAVGEEFQRLVANSYRKLAEAEPERVRLVDADRPVEAIVDEIMELIG